MSKIAIDARIINSSTGRYVERLIHYLEEIDRDNHYLILVRKKDLEFYTPTNPNFEIIEAEFDNYSLAEQIGFKKLLDELKPDLVHFCMPQQPVFYTGKHVTTVHDLTLLNTYNSDKNYYIFKAKQLVGQFVFKRIAKTSAQIIVPSQYTKDAYVQFAKINPEKITLTYEAADKSENKPLPYADLTNKEYILYVGSQSDYKNIRRLMEAHQLLLQNHPDLLLVLVGKLTGKNGAPLRSNKEWAETEKFKNIHYTDFVSNEQLAWLYQNSKAYVFPSLMEGFGLPGLEAMLNGAPVGSSNATCLPEVYGDAAEYFNPTNVIGMAAAIERVIGDPTRSKELIELGHKQAAKYSWRRMAEQTLAVYKNVLKKEHI